MSKPQRPALSVIVPLYDEEESVPVLVEEIRAALAEGPPWELLLVDDGSTDRTAAVAAELAAADPRVVLLRLARNYGQTQAMQAGFDTARGDVIVSLDGDLQNDPAEIPRLVAKLEQGYDLVAGYRENRQDDYWTRTFPSSVANVLIRFLTKVPIRDNGCSLKAYRRSTLDRMHLYSDLHRFLPALAAATAGARITELSVHHRPRRFGSSKYGVSRILKILADLLTITMISWFRERPFLLFGGGALVAVGIGALFLAQSLVMVAVSPREVAEAWVYPAIGLLAILLGCFLGMLGLIGELAVRTSRESDGERLPLSSERPL